MTTPPRGDGWDRAVHGLLDALAGPASAHARNQLLGALRASGLLSAGEEFAATVEAFAAADNEQRKRILREWLGVRTEEPGSPATSDEHDLAARDLHPLVEGLLRQLPPPGGSWTAVQRQRWLDLAALIVDSLYPVEPSADPGPASDDR